MENRISKNQKREKKKTGQLLGLGLTDDGHKRITKGKDFVLLGGDQQTHEIMTETVIKTTEDLKRKGRELSTAEPKEVMDLLKKNTPKI